MKTVAWLRVMREALPSRTTLKISSVLLHQGHTHDDVNTSTTKCTSSLEDTSLCTHVHLDIMKDVSTQHNTKFNPTEVKVSNLPSCMYLPKEHWISYNNYYI